MPLSAQPDPCPVAAARKAIARRRARRVLLPQARLFRDPAGDMVLDLYVADTDHRGLPAKALCLASGLPRSTALRMVRQLHAAGVIVRSGDPADGRRTLFSLAAPVRAALDGWFARGER